MMSLISRFKNKPRSISLQIVALFIVIIANSSVLFSQVVARVGSNNITSEQLTEAISLLGSDKEHLSYLERRDIALEGLIKEELILIYARDTGIVATNAELEGYFISQFGDHPNFTTNGIFDRNKFINLRQTPQVRRILNDLRRELLILKTETILKNQFSYPDNRLLDRYIVERTEIDLSYALIREQDVNIPTFIHPEEVLRYYEEQRETYPTPDIYNIEFFVVPFADFALDIEITEEEIEEFLGERDEPVTPLYRQMISRQLQEEKVKDRAKEEALRSKERLQISLNINYPIFTKNIYGKSYFKYNNVDVLKRLSITELISEMDVGEYSEPLETEIGYLVFKVSGLSRDEGKLPYDIVSEVWREYYNAVITGRYKGYFLDHYRQNLSDFIVPAAHVTSLVIDISELREKTRYSDRDLRVYYENNIDSLSEEEKELPYFQIRERIRELYLEKIRREKRAWSEENILYLGYDLEPNERVNLEPGVYLENRLVYLDRYENEGTASELVRQRIESEPARQINSLETTNYEVVYRINSFFPAYLPSLEEIESYLITEVNLTLADNEIDYESFYEEHKHSFVTTDSLQLAGIYIPIEPDTNRVDDRELREFYDNNPEQFFAEPKITFEYIFVRDEQLVHRELVNKLRDWASSGVPIQILNFCYGNEIDLPQEKAVEQSMLPSELLSYLNDLSPDEIGYPIFYRNGWFIARKIDDVPPKIIGFEDARSSVEIKLRRDRGDRSAYQKARQAFGEIVNIRNLNGYPDSSLVFVTEMKGSDQNFSPLGNIVEYLPRINNLRRNERLNTIFASEDGYGIVFLVARNQGRTLTYEEALPSLREFITEEQKAQNALNYVNQLRDLIINGEDPDKMLLFFGGWKQIKNLTFNDQIPGIENSHLVIEDAAVRNVGEVSHVVKISPNECTFYRVDRKSRVSRDEFVIERDFFRDYVRETDYQKWLRDYRREQGVEKF